MADTSFEAEFLQTHNTYRSKHGAPPLTMSPTLCRSAQKWAQYLLSIKTLQHSQGKEGENLYYSYSSESEKLTGCEAVDSWYGEIKDYHFNRPGFTSKTGHFTQVVWKDSREMGVGMATDGQITFVVGHYLPAGNISNPGYFEKNVLPPGSKADTKSMPNPKDSQFSKPMFEAGKPSTHLEENDPQLSSTGGRRPTTSDAISFEAEFLQKHNTYRSKHGAPPLTISQTLCRSAQKWAQYLLSIKTLQHSQEKEGENLYYSYSSESKKLTGCEAVDSWYGEIKDYHFNRPGFTAKTGHFTQVVWKDSRELGVGMATDGQITFVVGHYLPAGNISNPGYFEKNVLPPGSKADTKSTPNPKDSQFSKPMFEAGKPSTHLEENDPQLSSTGGRRPTTSDISFEAEFLQTHNTYRSKHGAPPLTMSPTLCRSAQKWAQYLLSIKTLQHSQGKEGENLYYSYSSESKKLTGCEAVDSWYGEIKDYHFNRPGFTSKTGHFTQVVWKDSRELGVGMATDGQITFVVGHYLPAGNISNPGYFEKNVLPPGSKADTKSTPNQSLTSRLFSKLHFEENEPPLSSDADRTTPDLPQFRNQLLAAVNRYRQRHRVQPLSLCPALSKEAQDWAAYLVSIKTMMNNQKGHGESMSYLWTSTLEAPTAEEVAESWYKEGTKYNFSSPGFQSGTGNFTQMVWKSSERAGVGQATDGKGMFITVIFYEPAGNITNSGYFQDNVKAAGSGAR